MPPPRLGVRALHYAGAQGLSLARLLTAVDVDDPAEFDIRVTSFGDPGFELHRFTTSPMRIRLPQMFTRAGTITLAMTESGRGSYRVDGGTARPLGRSAVVLDPTRTMTAMIAAPSTFLIVNLRREELLLDPRAQLTSSEAPLTAHLTATRSYLASILDAAPVGLDASSAVVRGAVVHLLRDLVHYAYANRPIDAVLPAVRAAIVKGAPDPRFHPESVAATLALSLRTLQRRISAETGTTLRELILRERAGLAKRLLMDRARADMGLSEIAEASGFGSAMTLRRAIKQCYDTTPDRLRRT
ncbi:helix-turn-helix transcriptional regulator [Microbacterium sp. NPDC056052]|uniref:helix-turn-helix transcriptional regulator n=1 Tax=Microbacterium sp. NPDC056052 TaxID=3345695 RepID=UPI0035DFC032